MSAIAGAYARGGAPIDRRITGELNRRLQFMGPDGESCLTGEGVVLLHRPFHTCDPTVHAAETLSRDGCLLTWDGRLDNAAELHAQCPAIEPGASDARMALAIYAQFGPDGLERLVGDFAFALWDGGARRLVLCRDALGRRLLYYAATPQHLYWASAARALEQALAIGPAPDEAFVASFLLSHASPQGPYKGTRLLPPGHLLIASGTDIAERRYWTPDPRGSIVYRTDADYEEHFRTLFAQAVRNRMRATHPVFVEVSGGIDSSSVACVAAREAARDDGIPRPRFLSYTFQHSTTADESRHIEEVERFVGQRGLHLAEDECPLLNALPDGFVPDEPAGQLLFEGRLNRVAREMYAGGSRVVLTGLGGDELFYSEPPFALPLTDLLMQGRLRTLARESRRWARHAHVSVARTFWRGALAPLLPRVQFRLTNRNSRIPSWIAPAFARRFELRDRLRGMPDDVGFRLPTARRQYQYIRSKLRPPVLENYASEHYVEARHPYLDRRLMEFALAIPADQKLRPGQERSVVRRGLQGIMPPSICARKDKRGPDEALYRALGHQWWHVEALFRDPLTAAYGIVDAQPVREMLRRARHGVAGEGAVMLVKIIALEMWLAATHGRRFVSPHDPDPSAAASTRGGTTPHREEVTP